MEININHVADIKKLLVFVRMRANGDFRIATELLDEALTRLSSFAKENGISIKIVSPSGERVIEFTSCGIIAGAALGYIIGQLPGAAIGAVAGGAIGYFASHVTLVMDRPHNGDHVSIKIA